MTDEFPEIRKNHPYVMYEMLGKVPDAVRLATDQFQDITDNNVRFPIYLTGSGTSFHATSIASYPFHRPDVFAVQSYELKHYWNPTGTILALSHTGKTKATVDAVSAHRENNYTIGISHYKDSPLLKVSEKPITIEQSPDLSLCNTKSFFAGSIAVYSLLHNLIDTAVSPTEIYNSFSKDFPGLENQAKEVADRVSVPDRVFVLGAGPNFVSAREVAQKIKEATHIQAEGIELEEFNHGCTSVIDENSLLIIMSSKRVEERAKRISEACRIVGTKTVTVNGPGSYTLNTDPISEDFSPYHNIAALYFFAYYLSLKVGVNPDMLRMENNMYREFDSTVFPPGEH